MEFPPMKSSFSVTIDGSNGVEPMRIVSAPVLVNKPSVAESTRSPFRAAFGEIVT
jgi:hypothetical protein